MVRELELAQQTRFGRQPPTEVRESEERLPTGGEIGWRTAARGRRGARVQALVGKGGCGRARVVQRSRCRTCFPPGSAIRTAGGPPMS